MRVGAFQLEKKIGAGGMGEIWLARHTAQGVPAAVKFDLHPPDATWREAFLAEVRRIAELDHPNVVNLFDTGLVTRDEARDSDTRLVEGMPWLAMELARGGAVADAGNMPGSWDEVRHVLLGLLRGLAHAHARGIVHRDIKPGNLLLAGPRSSRVVTPGALQDARVVLSDFGIGHDLDRPGWMDEQSVGTPRYMAPEQIEANWRDQGPWTDLYQTGVLAWRLACGRYPFEHKVAIQLYRAHLLQPLPAFSPAMPVPSGLEPLLRALLEKDWRDRPAFAGDVIAALEAMEDASGAAPPRPLTADDPSLLPTVAEPAATDGPTHHADAPTRVTSVGPRQGATGLTASRAPTGATRAATETTAGPVGGIGDMGLRGAGLGLWGLRPPPLVGREPERDTLWQALAQVARTGEPRAVAMLGAAGVGKTRLADWISSHAHERAAAEVLRAEHSPDEGDEHGLRGLFRRALRLAGLPRDEAAGRVASNSGLDATAQRLLLPWLMGPAEGERVPTLAEQLGLFWRFLEGRAARRPLLVVVDDAHHGAGTLRILAALLRDVRSLPALFVVALRPEELDGRPEERRRVDALLEGARCQRLDVSPLAEREQRALVRKMLGLEGELAVEVERRAAGNPAFAVQLVNSWVRGGELEVGPRGFRLRGGLREALPADLLAVWARRVGQLADELGPTDLEALELAALIGVDVDVRAWRAVCAARGVRLRPGLIGRLVRAHLLAADGRVERITFTHNGIREALLERLRQSGREAPMASAVADHLRGTVAPPGRLAELLLAAGRYEDAAQPLLDATEEALDRGDLRSARWLERFAGVLDALRAPDDDERWGMLWLNRAWYHRLLGERELADRYAAKAELNARRRGWKSVLGWALREAGSTALDNSEYDDAIAFFTEAEQVLLEAGRRESAAWCRNKRGVAHDFRGDFRAAEEAYRSCIADLDASPRAWGFAASPWLALAQLYQKQGRLDEALAHAEQARWRAERVGQVGNLAHIEMLLGEVERHRGDLDAADEHYRASIELYASFHDPTSVVPTLNLGVVGVLRGQYAETRALMESLLAELEAADRRPLFAAYARSVLMACAACLGDAEAALRAYDELVRFLDRTGAADPDIERLARIAAEGATDPRVRERAARLALSQRASLGG